MHLLNLVGKVIFDLIQQGKMNSLVMKHIDAFNQVERFIDEST